MGSEMCIRDSITTSFLRTIIILILYDFINVFSWKILLGVLVVSSTLFAIDNPMEYARLVLDNEMQAWVD